MDRAESAAPRAVGAQQRRRGQRDLDGLPHMAAPQASYAVGKPAYESFVGGVHGDPELIAGILGSEASASRRGSLSRSRAKFTPEPEEAYRTHPGTRLATARISRSPL